MKTIAFTIFSLLLSIAAQAWTPPIGIPAPNWGPTIGNPIEAVAPKPPENWTSNIPNIYYVQSGGTNQNQGYPGNPRNEIPAILPAGSVVYVNGVYTQEHYNYIIRHSGTAESPCWILSFDPLKPAKATKSWGIGAATSYLIIDNIDWDWSEIPGGGLIETVGGVDHICFRNGSTKGSGSLTGDGAQASTFIIQSSGSFDNGTEQFVISNMNISRGGSWMYSEGDPDAHGVSLTAFVQDVWVVDCEISYFSGCAVTIGGGIPSTPDATVARRIYVGRTTAHHVAQSAIWSKRSQDCVMSQNTVYGLRRNTPSSPNSSGLGGQYGPRNLWIIYNTVYDCQAGVKILSGTDNANGSSDTDVYIIGNVLYNIHDAKLPRGDQDNTWNEAGVCIAIWGGYTSHIINNTMNDFDGGVYGPGSSPRVIEGNIFSNRATAVSGYHFNLAMDPSGNNVYRYNIIEDPCMIKSGDSTYTTLSALNAAKGPGNSNVAPTYVNAGLGNYALAEGSNGVDDFGATPNKVYELFQSLYGRSIKVDRSGGARPFNNLWDIGAYEFGSVGAPENPPSQPNPPSRPTGPAIDSPN